MPRRTFHFLNVKDGDCSVIEHGSGHVTVVDVCNARSPDKEEAMSYSEMLMLKESSERLAVQSSARKNYGQKAYPENPITYLQDRGITSIFRFASTHPDMDHLDGIKDLFDEFSPTNFVDSDNNKEMTDGWDGSRYRKEDWTFYKSLRDGKPQTDPKRLTLYSGDDGIHRRRDWDGNRPGDALHTLAPTPALVNQANETDEYHDASYVFMYNAAGGRILLSGDSHDNTWDHILSEHADLVADVELLIAPHHGRSSGRSYDFLDTVNPKMTFFGNAPSKDLAYASWRSRNLPYITNNQAGTMIVSCQSDPLSIYVTNEEFARDRNANTSYSGIYGGWYLQNI